MHELIFKRNQAFRGRFRVTFHASPKRNARRGAKSATSLVLLLGLMLGTLPVRLLAAEGKSEDTYKLTKLDNDLLDDISRRSFRYFWDNMNPRTGLVLDRARTNGAPDDNPEHQDVSSIAATGFGLAAMCIGAKHRWVSPRLARKRVLAALRFFANQAPQEHGWFFHFLDAKTGRRQWKCEVSSIATALLLAGILTARQYFADDPEIVRLATLIYDRVDFHWMLNGDRLLLSHGWKPETGFLPYRWDTYSEATILYVLGIGSPTYPISGDSWYAWKLPVVNVSGRWYIGGGPLFIQQYSQAYLDLRDRVYSPKPLLGRFVPRINFYGNSVAATRAQQALGVDLSKRFPGYSSNVWGITASDSSKGYVDWGATPNDTRIDGTVVPSAAAGSLMFTPAICIPALRTMLLKYGSKIYGRYGFADAFNPTTGWVSKYVIGIDVGITLLSAENLRTGYVWQWFMSSPEIERALYLVGLMPAISGNSPQAFDSAGSGLWNQPKRPSPSTEIYLHKPAPISELERKVRINLRKNN